MTQICRQYASKGSCMRGSRCKFLHQRSSDSEKPPPDLNIPAASATISDASIPQICRYYASRGSCQRGTKCKFVHQRSSERPPPDTSVPDTNPITSDASPTTTTARYPDSSRETCSGGGNSRPGEDVNVLLMRIAELEEELVTVRQARLEAERDAEEAREAQVEAERGEEEAIHAHQDAEDRADRALQAMQASESRLNQAVQTQKSTELKAKEAETKMHNAIKAQKVAELKSKEEENRMGLEVRARHAAEIRAKDAETRADDATKARKQAELAARTATQRELQAIEEAKHAKAEVEAKVPSAPFTRALPPAIKNPALTSNTNGPVWTGVVRPQHFTILSPEVQSSTSGFDQAEAKTKVNSSAFPAQLAHTLPPAVINSAPTSNADAFLARKRTQSAAKEQAFTIQRIVSGSTLVTFGPGLEVQSRICGFDNGLVEVKDIPYQATMDEITSLFTAINTRFCLIDIRQYEQSSIIATIAVREDIKQRVADAITGKSIKSKVVTAKALKTMVGYATPRHHTVVMIPSNNPALSTSHDALEHRLTSAPGIMSFQFDFPYRSRITAWFNSESAANQARNYLRFQSIIVLDHECSDYRMTGQKSAKHALIVPLDHYGLHETGKTIPKYGEMLASSGAAEFTTQTKNLGYESFNGWQWFDDATTKTFFASKLLKHSILIKWDCIERTLTVYTDSSQSMRQVSALLESFTTQSRKAVFYQTIDINTAKSLVQNKKLEELTNKVGEHKVSLEVLRSRPVIKYKGGQSFFAVRQLMEDIEINQRTEDETKERCTVCHLEVSSSASIALTCGHQYCIPCLKHSILTAAEPPIICSGYNYACKRPVAIPIIQSLFSPSVFQTLVEKIAQSYFQHSDQFRYCITAGCTQVYCCSKEPNYITCSSCNATLCSSCHSKSHGNLACNNQLSQENKNEAQTAPLSKELEHTQSKEIVSSGSDANTSERTDGCVVM